MLRKSIAMKINKTIHYLCFYASSQSNYDIFPSAIPKIEYIIKTLKKNHEVVVVSIAKSKKGFIKSSVEKNSVLAKTFFFHTFKSRNLILDKIDVLFRYIQLIFYIFLRVKKNDTLLIYHSLFYFKIIKILKYFKKIDYVIQVEELYSSVTPNLRHLEDIEVGYLKTFKKIIVVNDLLKKKFSTNIVKPIVCYGDYSKIDYKFESQQKVASSEVVLIYAGVIEQVRKAAFFAIDIIKFLPDNYKLFILGFGDDKDILSLISKIDNFNGEHSNRIIFKGYLSGKKYSQVLLSADIGLSCHQYSDEDIISADNSFPSKILTYLKHNLYVVSNDIKCVEKASIANEITFFSDNDPEKAANAIKDINYFEKSDKLLAIKNLDEEFTGELKTLLK